MYPYLGSLLGLTLEPDAAARLAELSPEALQYRTFEVMQELLHRLASERPVIVAIEDVHWIDPTSLVLLERLLGADRGRGSAAGRHRSVPTRTTSRRTFGARRAHVPAPSHELTLHALAGGEEHELLHALVGVDALPADLERRLLDQAEGNPFFLEELVAVLADSGALVESNGGYRFDHEMPVEIPADGRAGDPGARRSPAGPFRSTLTAASVLGRQFGLALLEGVAPGDDLRESLRELQRLDLIRESRRWPQPEFRFKHVLIQEAVYRTIVGDERRRLHREAAEWLERAARGGRGGGARPAAHHWLAAADEHEGDRLPDARGRQGAAGVRPQRGDRALPRPAPSC